ncbi:MAG: hypothetical protein VB104_07920 [Candidatus Limiplasma sp.]|nr:hypothetical protein [Candidatus Limiplasma sp.]
MHALETVKSALDGLGYDVRKWPGKTGETTYIALSFLTLETVVAAGNMPRRRVAHIQVDLYSKLSLDDLTALATVALEAAGCPVESEGPETFEDDTQYHHMPIVCVARHTVGPTD